jgi:demethylmenaquinone methyltransferase/2-methoxy-6-polyprenyl-1,4-benzoquinol methylase
MTIFGTIALYTAVKPVKPSHQVNTREQLIEARDEKARYYSAVRRYMRLLAPFYDTGTLPISSLRDKVVNLTNAPKGSRILDVGTGTGKQAFAFAKKGFNVTGIDLSEDMIKVAQTKNRYEHARFQIGDAANLPFEDSSFDVTSVSFALHDMIPAIRRKALKEMARVTKPHGTIVVVDYALPKNRILSQLVFNFVRLYELYYPEFIRSNLKGLLNDSGIKVSEELHVLLGAARIIKGIKND